MNRSELLKQTPDPVHWFPGLPESGSKPVSVLDWERAASEAMDALRTLTEKLEEMRDAERRAIADAERNWTDEEISRAIADCYVALPMEFRDSMVP